MSSRDQTSSGTTLSKDNTTWMQDKSNQQFDSRNSETQCCPSSVGPTKVFPCMSLTPTERGSELSPKLRVTDRCPTTNLKPQLLTDWANHRQTCVSTDRKTAAHAFRCKSGQSQDRHQRRYQNKALVEEPLHKELHIWSVLFLMLPVIPLPISVPWVFSHCSHWAHDDKEVLSLSSLITVQFATLNDLVLAANKRKLRGCSYLWQQDKICCSGVALL